ncbi:MAG TPA: hypothetical protein VG993_08360 [Actinomycetota bacterium]|nr:hypothetical protein [Actinomycetota bacterium]
MKEDEIAATYADGVLEVVLPGAAPKVELPEEPLPEVKTIPVKAA